MVFVSLGAAATALGAAIGKSLRNAQQVGGVLIAMLEWTPCVVPVLASILLYAGTAGSMQQGAALLAAYSIGLGMPFLAAAFALDRFLTRLRGIKRWLRPLELVAGALLVIVGVVLATGQFRLLTSFLAGFGQLVTLGP